MNQLASFIRELENRGLLEFDVLNDDESSFANRFMIQKYVYLARYFDFDLGYNFGMYLHGPYSRHLADDYYNLAEIRAYDETKYLDLASEDLNGILSETFFEFVGGKDPGWLEAATTLLSLKPHFNDRKLLVERTANMKSHIPEHRIESILRTLEEENLVTP
jgi:uncharacterized protein YwgA